MQSHAFRISEQHQAVVIPFDARVKNTVPHAKVLQKNGNYYHVVPHRHTETRLLNNFGYKIPAPILNHYDWCGTTPFESQRVTAALMTENRRAYILNDLGTGKTRAALYAIDYMMKTKEIDKVLVVAPLSTLTTVWEREVFECFPHLETSVLYGTKARRLQALERDVDIYIINHDGLKVIENELKARKDIEAVIIDELTMLRNGRSKRWKITNGIVATRPYLWGMTGAPMPKAPTDAFGQIKLLTPHNIEKTFGAFRTKTMYQLSQFRWEARKNAKEYVYQAMMPHVRYERSDCFDLPPTTYSTYEVEMTAGQKKAYKDMFSKLRTDVLSQPGPQQSMNGLKVIAANTGVKFNKLLQIGAGFIYGKKVGKDVVTAEFDSTPRVNLLKEIVSEASGKVIVFVPFKHLVNMLMQKLSVEFTTAEIHGGTTKAKRDEVFSLFQNALAPRVLVAHPGTMSHGLTLTAADTIVWYSPVFDLDIYGQANARITRPGQKLHTHIIHIQASSTEKKIYNTLQKRGNMQAALLDLFRGT